MLLSDSNNLKEAIAFLDLMACLQIHGSHHDCIEALGLTFGPGFPAASVAPSEEFMLARSGRNNASLVPITIQS